MERLTDVTKRDIFEMFRDGITDSEGPFDLQIKYPYNGRLDEIIVQHTINNNDYPDCWVFSDDRFKLSVGSDEIYLNFICEVFHPYVRDERKEWKYFFNRINKLIRVDGYELYQKEQISGREVYGWRLCGAEVAVQMSDFFFKILKSDL